MDDLAVGADDRDRDSELSFLLPCLNEERTIAACVRECLEGLHASGTTGEVLVADNGSVDESVAVAASSGARVVCVSERGYGAALAGGINAARSTYVIMGDADGSYNFLDAPRFLEKLREGQDLVIGNRFSGGIANGAMPVLHRYVGNPLLSGVGRALFGGTVRDFHCGLRGFRVESIRSLGLKCAGMEFASEMIVKALLGGLRVCEVPTNLRRDGRDRRPHLRTFRDGWRHLRFMLSHAHRRYSSASTDRIEPMSPDVE
jgi:glycosyltransferase involved in cell wall biosynthesis